MLAKFCMFGPNTTAFPSSITTTRSGTVTIAGTNLSFSTVCQTGTTGSTVTAGGYTAMSPAFSAGDSRILVGAIPGWIYHDDSKAVTPFDSVPESTSQALSFAFSPAYGTDQRLLIGGTDSSPAQGAVVSVCRASLFPKVTRSRPASPPRRSSRRSRGTG